MNDPDATDGETEAALAERLTDLPDRLRDEADAAVASARDTDDLGERLADLRTEHDIADESDGANATTAAESDETGDGVFGRVRSRFDGVRDRVAGDDAASVGDTDADPPVLPGVERSRELAADVR